MALIVTYQPLPIYIFLFVEGDVTTATFRYLLWAIAYMVKTLAQFRIM